MADGASMVPFDPNVVANATVLAHATAPSSVAPADDANAAGSNAVPIVVDPNDEESRAPMIAYFTFIQNNMAQIQSGNVEAVMNEAENRHREIMQHVVQGYQTAYDRTLASETARITAEAQRFVQMAQESSQAAEQRAVAAGDRLAQVQSELEALQRSYAQSIKDLRAEAEAKHDLAMESLRKQLTDNFSKTIDENIEYAKELIDAERQSQNNRLAQEETKYSLLQATVDDQQREIERLKQSNDDQLAATAIQNDQLQQVIDDLQNKVSILENALSEARSSSRAFQSAEQLPKAAVSPVPTPAVRPSPTPMLRC